MAKRAIDRDLWDVLVAAFERHGPNYAVVAKHSGCDPRTAKRAFEEGWPRKHLTPIVDELERRAEEAREARRQFERERAIREQERREAERQAIEKRHSQEESLSTSARVNSLTLQRATSNMLLVAVPLAEELLASHKAGTLKLSPKEKATLIRDTALILRMANDTAERSLRVERLRTSLDGTLPEDKTGIDIPTAVEYLDGMERTIRRARAIEMRKAPDGSFEPDPTRVPSARRYDA